MRSGRTLVDLAQELQRQLSTKRDLVVPTSLMSLTTSQQGRSTVAIEEREAVSLYGITELARRQLADKLKIPYVYFERMRAQQPTLLDSNVNTWLREGDDARLIRTLDGQVRAVLSDRFRPLDNYDLAEHVLPILQGLPGARFESVELTDTRMYLKVVSPGTELEIAPGDIVQAGVSISNSEVGLGSLLVQPLVFRLVCKNGLIASSALRKNHVGRVLESDADTVKLYQDDTLRADDKAFFMKVRDVVRAAVSDASFTLVAEKLRRTMGIKLVGDPVKAVEVLANRYSLNESESSGVLRQLIAEGQLTGYALVNAVTGYSQEVESYDRATELEALGGRLIEQSQREWQELAQAA
jgi:hypothetical protein